MQQPAAELRPAPLFAAVLAATFLCAIAAALASNHPLPLKVALLLATAALLAKSWQDEIRRGVRRLEFSGEEEVLVHCADGRTHRGRYAGHALLGTIAVFIFIERQGWQRIFGPKRLAISRDATDADSFRRLRSRVRLGF